MRSYFILIFASIATAHCSSVANSSDVVDARAIDAIAIDCADGGSSNLTCDPAAEAPIPVDWNAPCDGISAMACAMWAHQNAGSANAFSVCNQLGVPRDGGADFKCARADHHDRLDPFHFLCGCEDACPPGAVCVADQPGGEPHCRCM